MKDMPTATVNPFTGQKIGTFSPVNSNITVRPVIDPNQMHSSTGVVGSPLYNQFFRSDIAPGQLDTRSGFGAWGKGSEDYLAYLNGLNSNGYTYKGINGENVSVSPETIEFFKQISPWLDKNYTSEEAKRAAMTSNITNLYMSRGLTDKLGLYKNYNNNIAAGINNWNMRAMQLLSSSDSKERLEGERMMNIGARAQMAFNEAQPRVQQAVQARIQPYKNFLSNNWWWMIPGGLLALGGIGSLLMGRGQEEQPDAQQAGWPFAKGAPAQQQNLPPGWTSGIAPETPQTPAMGV